MYEKQKKAQARSAQLRAELVAKKRAAAKNPVDHVAVDFDHLRAVLGDVPEERRGAACAHVSNVLAETRRQIADGDFR